MKPIISFIKYFIDAIKDYDYLNEYEINFREVNILPNFYIGCFIVKKKS